MMAKVKVVNMSLGLPKDIRNIMGLRDANYALKKMVAQNPETLFVVAAGNSIPGVNIDETKNHQFPANIEGDNIITVGSIDSDHINRDLRDDYSLAHFSNFGERYVDILAPGEKVSAASLGGGEIVHSGTSMATPYMVNEIIRLWQKFPELKSHEVKNIFMESAYQLPSAPLIKTQGLVDGVEAERLARKIFIEKRWDTAQSMELEDHGLNCWNSSLYLAGLLDELRYTNEFEFREAIESQSCIQVEEPQYGDIVALRRTNAQGRPLKAALHSEIHGYTYINEEMGYTKNGFGKSAPYIEQRHDEIFSFYQRTNRIDCKNQGIPKEFCNLREMYYRCQK